MKYLIIIIAVLSFSFTQKEPIDSTIIKGKVSPSITKLYLNRTRTQKLIAKIPVVDGRFDFSLSIDEPLYTTLSGADDLSTLLILTPLETTMISQDSIGGQFYSNHKADVVLNELWKSFNNWLARKLYAKQLSGEFELKNSDEVKMGIGNWVKKERLKIDSMKAEFSDFEYRFLVNNTTHRAYNFLFYYGRLMSDTPPSDSFFDFVDDIDVEYSIISGNVLYKLEIEYNRKIGKINTLNDFFSFIGESIKDKGLRSYYQADYMRQLLANPSYWPQHAVLLNTNSLKGLENSFNALYPKSKHGGLYYDYLHTYYETQKGEVAVNFSAINHKEDTVKLSDLIGKVILIDVWATWCGPCLAERPNMLKIIDKYKEEDDFIPLMISTDKLKEKWKKYIMKEDVSYLKNNLLLVGEEKISFEKKYNITYIPRYILIDKFGKFISSKVDDLGSPSLITVIDNALAK